MAVDEARRIQLHDALRNQLGADAATTLMELLPPVGWADVATKQDVAHLEARLEARFERIESRFQRIDIRFEQMVERFGSLESKLDAKMEAGFNRALRWTVTTSVAMQAVTIAAVAALVR